jgi:Putative zincin peptidase
MIPGILITLLTFPGVIVHESAHMLFCRLRGVAVFDVCFFRLGNPCGYVSHERVKDFTSQFLVSVGPFIVNSLLCILFCLPASAPVRLFGQTDPVSYFFIWLGVSIGMHAFPSTGDAQNLWREAKQASRQGNVLAMLSFPLVVVIYAANLGRFFWLDYLYGAALGLALPEFVLRRVL